MINKPEITGFRPDTTDLRLLETIQDGVPVTSRPFGALASRLGVTEEEFIERIQVLEDAGVVLGITPVIEPRDMGLHAATLVALRVPDNRVEEVARVVSSFPQVSHNYRRDHEYAIWFTLSAPTRDHLTALLDEIRLRAGVPEKDMLNLPTVQKLKIGVRFSFLPDPGVKSHG